MNFDLIINNKYSMIENKIYIPSRPAIPINKKKVEYINIPGRDGTLTKFLGYDDRPYKIPFNFYEKDNIPERVRKITPILLGAKTFTFTDDLEMFYKVKNVEIEDVERNLKRFSTFNVNCIIEPFDYLVDGTYKFEIINSESIFNYGSYESRPIIKVYGQGNIQISINAHTFQVNNVEGYVIVDSELMTCYKDTVNKGNDMIGLFPVIDVGENQITLSSNITKVEITPNWRCL